MKKTNMCVGNYYNIYNHENCIKCVSLSQYGAKFEREDGRVVTYMYQQVLRGVGVPKAKSLVSGIGGRTFSIINEVEMTIAEIENALCVTNLKVIG